MEQQKGFTLIELLVVIAIVAILSAVVILTLNPAELLRQSRDSNRISDMSTLKSALALYLSDVNSPSLGVGCKAHASSGLAAGVACNAGGGTRFASTTVTWATSTSLAVDGNGWIPVNFNLISSGAPISVLPRDPVNNTTLYYAYLADSGSLTYELNTLMESTKFKAGGSGDVVTNDGGNSATLYEVGTDPGLDI